MVGNIACMKHMGYGHIYGLMVLIWIMDNGLFWVDGTVGATLIGESPLESHWSTSEKNKKKIPLINHVQSPFNCGFLLFF